MNDEEIIEKVIREMLNSGADLLPVHSKTRETILRTNRLARKSEREKIAHKLTPLAKNLPIGFLTPDQKLIDNLDKVVKFIKDHAKWEEREKMEKMINEIGNKSRKKVMFGLEKKQMKN